MDAVAEPYQDRREIHVRTFHCKMSDDALGFLDQQINEFLQCAPAVRGEVRAVCVGEFQGKWAVKCT